RWRRSNAISTPVSRSATSASDPRLGQDACARSSPPRAPDRSKPARPMQSRLRPLAYAALIVLTVASFVAITLRLRLDPNVSALLPDSGNAAAMKRYVRGFGGGDLGVVMVKGNDPDESAKVAAQIAEELRKRPSVEQAADRVDTSHTLDPMLAWRHADARTR